MSRTPLFRRLERTLALARRADLSQLPALEAVEAHARAPRLTRRSLLKLGGTFGLSAAVPVALPFLRSRRQPRIAIVGAGIAGLTCAYRLEQAGLRSKLFDSWNRVGGRMFSARGIWRDQQVAELGGELIDTEHEALRGLAAELGLTLDSIIEPAGNGIRQDTWYFEGRAVSDTEIVEAFRRVAPRLARDAASEDDDEAFTRLDELPLSDYLDSIPELTPMLHALIETSYLVEYGRETSEQSTWNLLWLIDSETPDPFRIYGDSDEAFHVHGGNDQIPNGLAARLGSPIVLDHQLTSVRARPDGAFRLGFDRGRGSSEEVFDHVVFALPFTRLRQVELRVPLPEEKRRVIAELGMGTNAKLIAQFRERVWRTRDGASGSVTTDNGLQQAWETSRGQAGKAGILTVFTGGHVGVQLGQGTAESQLRARLPELEQIFPGSARDYLDGSAVRMHWPSVEHTRGSYACYLPGQASFSGLEGERVGNLHFCGEHTSVDFQGFMNGGVESGERVASELSGIAAHSLGASRVRA